MIDIKEAVPAVLRSNHTEVHCNVEGLGFRLESFVKVHPVSLVDIVNTREKSINSRHIALQLNALESVQIFF